MKTVNEVSKLTGVSIRTLRYYDKIGLLKPTEYTESGYRLYDDAALERLQQILLFRELEFPLKDIKDIVTRSDFDKKLALDQQIELLELKNVQVVGGLVQQHDLGFLEQYFTQTNAHLPTVTELGHGALEIGAFEAHTRKHLLRLPHNHIATQMLVPVVGIRQLLRQLRILR